jgi:hypothetical protein
MYNVYDTVAVDAPRKRMRNVDTDKIACDQKDCTDSTSPGATARVFDMAGAAVSVA